MLDDMPRRSSLALPGPRRELRARARPPVSIDQRSNAVSGRQRGDGRAALEIVPLVLVEGPENFGRVEAPDFTADATTAGDQSREPAEVQEGAGDVPIVHERRPSGEQPVRGLAAHQRAVEEEEGRFSARGQAA